MIAKLYRFKQHLVSFQVECREMAMLIALDFIKPFSDGVRVYDDKSKVVLVEDDGTYLDTIYHYQIVTFFS